MGRLMRAGFVVNLQTGLELNEAKYRAIVTEGH